MSDKSSWVNRDNHSWIVIGVVWGFGAGTVFERMYNQHKHKPEDALPWFESLAMVIVWGPMVAILLALPVLFVIGGLEALLR